MSHLIGRKLKHNEGTHRAAKGDDRAAGQVDASGNDDHGRPQGKDAEQGGLAQHIDRAFAGLSEIDVLSIDSGCQQHNRYNGRSETPFCALEKPS
jgi:hypothetical protein